LVYPEWVGLLIDATIDRDYSVVSAVMLFFAVGLVLINLFVDLSYGYIDPRVSYK